MKNLLALCLTLVVALIAPRTAKAEDAPRATFALIIGSNQSVDANLTPLRYADDDAARYLDLFRLLGARTYLLSRLDDNTKRLHPQAAAEAIDPKKTNYQATLTALAADVATASARGVETTVYFVYAGHGNVDDKGQGYITLEDLRIRGNDLATAFAKIPATRIHLIADACASYFLAYSRGPGGERRPIDGFGIASALVNDSRVGLLLSTSSARESHEWDAFQSGVFSHEVRSGLYGAADADGDGHVSYHEIAAFVARANASIPNERYRPDMHARAPLGGDLLLDLHRANGRRIEVDGKHASHYFLEDARGVRIADFHNAADQTVSLIRPAPNGRTYLRNVDDDTEIVIEAQPDVVAIADLQPEAPRVAARGGASESFNELFSLAFDARVVAAFPQLGMAPPCLPMPPPPPAADYRPRPARPRWRTPVALGLFGFGVASLGFATFETLHSFNTRNDPTAGYFNGEHAAHVNHVVDREQGIATGFYIAGGLAAAGGLAVMFWPSRTTSVQVGIAPTGAALAGTF